MEPTVIPEYIKTRIKQGVTFELAEIDFALQEDDFAYIARRYNDIKKNGLDHFSVMLIERDPDEDGAGTSICEYSGLTDEDEGYMELSAEEEYPSVIMLEIRNAVEIDEYPELSKKVAFEFLNMCINIFNGISAEVALDQTSKIEECEIPKHADAYRNAWRVVFKVNENV